MSKDAKWKHHKKSYYPFSKDYPGRVHSSFAIGETRERRKREQRSKVLYAFFLLFLFVFTFLLAYTFIFFSKKPITENGKEPLPDVSNIVAVQVPDNALNGGIALDLFLKNLRSAHANAVLVEFKAEDGHLNYASSVKTAVEIGATARAYPNFSSSIATLKEAGYKIFASYSCYKDTLAASNLPGAAITLADGSSLWLDESAQKGGNPWLNPYAEQTTTYLLSLFAEAKKMGADGIVLKHVEFPTGRFQDSAYYPYAAESGLSKNAVLTAFLEQTSILLGDMPYALEMNLADVLFDSEKYDGNLLAAPSTFFCVNLQKTEAMEEALLANNAGFASLSQSEYLIPAVAALKAKTEAVDREKPIVVITTTENTPKAIRESGLEHVIYLEKEDESS